MLTTDQKGAVAEAAITLEAMKLGIGVLRPCLDERYDLIFDLRPGFVRVQCKWASRVGDVIVIRCYRCRRSADGLLRQFYSPEDVDAFAAYCADDGKCYYVPYSELGERRTIQLRLTPTRNSQHAGICWASEYEFAAKLALPGAVAQLGERAAGSR